MPQYLADINGSNFILSEENPNSTDDKTYFKKVSGKDFYPGMLIVQKKGK